ncbi:CPBP family intramembrane glutamic endopeptidase [Blattabacterium cuenoti]|uniref:CPBP family intramembrane glutamic endopeptidase n=1 Tax=Blattabacterium cuenoti TaxID=1653831 RepID=UPI00163C73AD|nr:type II CAAX endopeptidase family protein [Blattabacterium cuenoti]
MKNYFKHIKISYTESFLLVISFITINFFNIILRKLLNPFSLHEGIMFSISYAFPFILLFLIISYQIQKNNIFINLSMKVSPWHVYIVIFIMMFSIMTINDHLSSLIPRRGDVLENMYKEINFFLQEEVRNPIPFLSTTVLLAPICEELLFRGIILNGMLKNNIHPLKAILFSSLLFGLTHMNPWQLVGGILIGTFIGYIYYMTSSIMDCILLHIFNNALATIGVFYTVKDDNIISNINNIGIDKPFHWPVFVIGSFILTIGFYYLLKMRKMNKF